MARLGGNGGYVFKPNEIYVSLLLKPKMQKIRSGSMKAASLQKLNNKRLHYRTGTYCYYL